MPDKFAPSNSGTPSRQVVCRLRREFTLDQLVGGTPAFRAIIDKLPAIANCDASVLISGETGTGKELVARAIHYLSPRAPYPFVAVNCGSVPDALLEEEFFGHERGSFTDAHATRRGLIAQAEGGTFFLDEIDALSPKAQVSLLRVLQDHTFRAIGSSSEQRANVRVVTATNARMENLIREKRFRVDLYYRICVFSLELPALRDRAFDIPLLARHLLAKHGASGHRFSAAAEAALEGWQWPGNVRELENRIIRSIHLSQDGFVEAAHLGFDENFVEPPPCGARSSFKHLKQAAIESFEKNYLTRLMGEHGGNVTRAARFAGKERRELGKLLKKHGLKSQQFTSVLKGE
ncbi:MAG TPA: sigma-54 dependent transcriptional regulator [Bryobacteraceae bacterium]